MTDHSLPDFAIVVPMANEEDLFDQFVAALSTVLDRLGSGEVYFVVDKVSRDRTRALCDAHSRRDDRFHTVWMPAYPMIPNLSRPSSSDCKRGMIVSWAAGLQPAGLFRMRPGSDYSFPKAGPC